MMQAEYRSYEIDADIKLNPVEEFFMKTVNSFLDQNFEFRIYLCGGWVRDKILGIDSKDIDLISDFTKIYLFLDFLLNKCTEQGFAFDRKKEQTLTSGACKDLRLIQVSIDTTQIDFREWISPFDLFEDVKTRDFTCNGLYFDPVSRKLIDFCSGKKDIQTKTLKTIGDVQKTFEIDVGRFFRLVRFSVDKNFSISQEMKSKLNELNLFGFSFSQNKYNEFVKLFKSKSPHQYFSLIKEFQLYRIFDRNFDKNIYDIVKLQLEKMHEFLNSFFFVEQIKPNLSNEFSHFKLFCYCEWLVLLQKKIDMRDEKIDKMSGRKCFDHFKKKFQDSQNESPSEIIANANYGKESKFGFPFLALVLRKMSLDQLTSNPSEFDLLRMFFEKGFQQNLNSFSQFKFFFENRPEISLDKYLFTFFDCCSTEDIEKFVKYASTQDMFTGRKFKPKYKEFCVKIGESRYESRGFLKKFWDYFLTEKKFPANHRLTWSQNDLFTHFLSVFLTFETEKIPKQTAK